MITNSKLGTILFQYSWVGVYQRLNFWGNLLETLAFLASKLWGLASSQSLRFILSLKMNSSFITSRLGTNTISTSSFCFGSQYVGGAYSYCSDKTTDLI